MEAGRARREPLRSSARPLDRQDHRASCAGHAQEFSSSTPEASRGGTLTFQVPSVSDDLCAAQAVPDRLRILFITDHTYPPQRVGGAESSTHDLALTLKERGVEVAVLATIDIAGYVGF